MAAAASLPLRHFRSLDAPGGPTAPPGAQEDLLRAMAAAAPGTAAQTRVVPASEPPLRPAAGPGGEHTPATPSAVSPVETPPR